MKRLLASLLLMMMIGSALPAMGDGISMPSLKKGGEVVSQLKTVVPTQKPLKRNVVIVADGNPIPPMPPHIGTGP